MTESPSLFMDSLSVLWRMLVFPGGFFALVIGLFFLGLDGKLVARMQRRVGASIWQPFFDNIKLLFKISIIPERHKGIFIALPIAAVLFSGICAALLPISGSVSPTIYRDDGLFFYCMLLLPSLTILGAGFYCKASYYTLTLRRSLVTLFAYAVPFVLIMCAVVLKTGGTFFSFKQIISWQQEHGALFLYPSLWPAFLAYMLSLPAAMGSTPFSMSEGEAESLGDVFDDYSGILFLLFNVAKSLRLFAIIGLGVTLFFPGSPNAGAVLGTFLFLVKSGCIMIFGITLIKVASGSLRTGQLFSFCCKWPVGLSFLSLIFVWLNV